MQLSIVMMKLTSLKWTCVIVKALLNDGILRMRKTTGTISHQGKHYQTAFQFGVKMNDGCKTRRQGVKSETAKLNREWQQISQILQKRKSSKTEFDSKAPRLQLNFIKH